MPLIKVQTSLKDFDNSENLLKDLSAELSNLTSKPESYVMTLLQTGIPMTFGGSNEPSCFVEIKSIGSIDSKSMSDSFCRLISNLTDIPTNRIYINFENIKASEWGFNGKTFG